MAMLTSTNEVTVRRIASLISRVWDKMKSVFSPKENGVYYVPGTSGYANWSANTAYAVGANVVNPSGECWTCKTAHTSGSSWSSTNWNRISAVALTGTIDGVTALYAGLKIAYRFQVLGGDGSTTLNVNNLGAKTITRGTGAFYRWTIGRYGVAILVYDGSAWRFGDYDSNDQYVLPDAYCSTGAGTQAKAATSVGFNYSRHNNIPFRINFTNTNTYDGNLTLNVNSQGAKPLWINGSASSSSNKTIVVGVYWCYYDGTQFQLWTDKSLWAYKYRGDGSSLTETFSAASSRANIASGESNATIFGKIAKWLSDLKALAFKDKVSDSDISGTVSDNHIASASTWNGKQDALNVVLVSYNASTVAEVATIVNGGKAPVCIRSNQLYVCDGVNYGTSASPEYRFSHVEPNTATTPRIIYLSVNSSGWSSSPSVMSLALDSAKMKIDDSDNPDYDGLTASGIYRITSSADPATTSKHSPESGRMTLIVINTDNFVAQMAMGYDIYFRYKKANKTEFETWKNIVTSDSKVTIDVSGVVGTTNNTLYFT